LVIPLAFEPKCAVTVTLSPGKLVFVVPAAVPIVTDLLLVIATLVAAAYSPPPPPAPPAVIVAADPCPPDPTHAIESAVPGQPVGRVNVPVLVIKLRHCEPTVLQPAAHPAAPWWW
jgi:hypothetical protein